MNEKVSKRITAYLTGTMTPREKNAFELMMKNDRRLRDEVEEWRSVYEATREWAGREAPGVDRVESLAIPMVESGRKGFIFHLTTRYGYAAVAAVFLIGFCMGRFSENWNLYQLIPFSLVHDDLSLSEGSGEQLGQPGSNIVLRKQDPGSVGGATAKLGDGQLSISRTYDEDGKLIIETNLESGSRALWVVDGNFQLTSADDNRPMSLKGNQGLN